MDLDRSGVLTAQLGNLEKTARAVQLDTIVGIAACIAYCAVAALLSANQLLVAAPILPAVAALIIWLFARLFVKRPPPLPKVTMWENLYAGLNALAGLGWGIVLGASIYLQTDNSLIYLAVALVAILTLLKLAVFAGIRMAAPAFTAAALLATAVQFLQPVQVGTLIVSATALAAMVVVFLASSQINRFAKTSAETEARAAILQEMLDQRRTQVEKLNVALKTNEDKRQQVETNLRKASADLGLAAGKAQALATTLERVSPICQVTGLANRRHFNENLHSEWRRATRDEEPISIVILGIDEFESYIDNNGKQAAETLLKRVGQTLKGFGRRAGDMAGRYEEYSLALLLPGCDSRNAQRMAEAIRKRIEGSKIAHPGASTRNHVSAHVAVATTIPGRGLPSNELLKRAETALYEAKFQGGNKVVSYQPLSKLKLSRWDAKADGQLNEQSLIQKLLVWGYDTTQRTLRPNEPRREHKSDKLTVIALLNGKVILELEGHNMALKAGDTVFVPKNVVVHLTLVGEQAATIFTAVHSE